MSSARDRVLVTELSRRGLINEAALAPVLARRPSELARALVQHGVVEPAALARVLSDLGRAAYVCDPCGLELRFADLAGMHELRCSCGRPLSLRAESERRAPQRLGDYRLLHELGRGAMGVVYLAEHAELKRKFALKVIPQRVDRDTLERFRREAEVASRITDGGVVAVYDVGMDAGRMYYAMDYVPGETLKDRLRAGPLPHRRAAKLVASLARTVAIAHEAGVVHRDLKPGNVILDASGRTRLADFGLAQDLQTDQALTQTGWILGTPLYMAPEQAEDSKRSGPAADVYALGAILYRCLTGEPPHAAADMMELLRLKATDPPPARAHDPDIPVELERICRRALARIPAARPSARELADALETWVRGRRRPARRLASGVGLAVALVAAAGGGYAATAWRGGRQDPVEPRPPANTTAAPEEPAGAQAALVALCDRVGALRRKGTPPDRILEALLSGRGALRSRAERDQLEVLIVDHFLRLGRGAEVRERARALELEDPQAERVLGLLHALSYGADQAEEGRRRLELVGAGDDDVGLVVACLLAARAKRPLPLERLRRRARCERDPAPLSRVTEPLLRVRWAHHLIEQLQLDDAEAWLEELEAADGPHALVLWARVGLAHARRAPNRALASLERLVAQAAPEVHGSALDQLAQTRFNTGDARGALRAMKKLLALPAYAQSFEHHMNYGMMLNKMGLREDAGRAWVRAARLGPRAFRRFLVPLGPRASLIIGEMLPSLRFVSPPATPALEAAAAALVRGVSGGARRTLREACLLAMRGAVWRLIAEKLDTARVRTAADRFLVARLQLGRDRFASAEISLIEAERLGLPAAAAADLRRDILRRRGRTRALRAALTKRAATAGDAGLLAKALLAIVGREPEPASAALAKVSEASSAERDALLAEVKLEQGDLALRERSGAVDGDALLLEGIFAADRAIARGSGIDGRVFAVRSRLLTRLCFGWGIPTHLQGIGRAGTEQVLRLLPGPEHRVEAARHLVRLPFPSGSPLVWGRRMVTGVLRDDPNNAEAWWVLGKIAVSLSESAEAALEAWRNARRLDPDRALEPVWRRRFERLHPARADALEAALKAR